MLGCMHTDRDACLRAIAAKDARFDGLFFTGVTSTGIYCRPSCPARTPAPGNVEFYPTAAAAQLAGFRACKRCIPGASPGSPEWDVRGDAVARAVRLIDDGVVDREGVPGLAARLGYSVRQVQRLLADGAGAGPVALARARRAQSARTLIEATDLPLTDVTLAAREPFCPCNVFGHLIATRIDGVEAFADGVYHRTLRLPSGWGVASLSPAPRGVRARVGLTDVSQLPTAVSRLRRMLDLDADPAAVDAHLALDPALAPLVAAHPGRRIPRGVDGAETAIKIVLGQQVSTAAARTHGARLVAAAGTPVDTGVPGLTHLFPEQAAIAEAPDEVFAFPRSRRDTLRRLATVLADGSLDLGPGADRDEARHDLLAVKGVGPWTVEMVAMRALGDPDAFPATDLGVLRAAPELGVLDLARRAEAWRPWRSYATQHLWALTPHAVNTIPGLPGCQETP